MRDIWEWMKSDEGVIILLLAALMAFMLFGGVNEWEHPTSQNAFSQHWP